MRGHDTLDSRMAIFEVAFNTPGVGNVLRHLGDRPYGTIDMGRTHWYFGPTHTYYGQINRIGLSTPSGP